MGRLGVVDELLDRGLVADVDADPGAADLCRDPLGLIGMQVGDDDMSGTGCVRSLGECFTDP